MQMTKLNSANELCIPSQTLLVFLFLCVFAFQYVLFFYSYLCCPPSSPNDMLCIQSQTLLVFALILLLWNSRDAWGLISETIVSLKNGKPENLNILLAGKAFVPIVVLHLSGSLVLYFSELGFGRLVGETEVIILLPPISWSCPASSSASSSVSSSASSASSWLIGALLFLHVLDFVTFFRSVPLQIKSSFGTGLA